MKKSCFVDTSFFKAYADKNDDFHTQALKIFQKLKETKTQLITTNFILDETFTLIRTKCGLTTAKEFKEILEQFESDFKIIRVLAIDEAKAWEWFLKDWSKLSFTDCVSFALMKRMEIDHVVAFDDHFQKAGFHIQK